MGSAVLKLLAMMNLVWWTKNFLQLFFLEWSFYARDLQSANVILLWLLCMWLT